ncbi:MAG: permease-like cell division protein FtsX [Duncaniella sp.]|nr:permease-like cell division protein FtsX [Duncaniella sp.]
MAKRRHHLIPLFSTRATATVSVALVLFILGLASLVGIAAHKVTEGIKENIGFVVLFNEDVTASEIAAVKKVVTGHPGTAKCDYSSPEMVLERWQKIVGEDEDIMSLAEVNPFVGEMDVHVTPAYASPDSIDVMVSPLMLMPQVSDIKVHTEMIDRINSTLRSVTLGLLIVAIALLVISFVLIFNTVRLSVYARRFTIHTMKLVGATPGFIRKPFLVDNVVNGLIAGIIAVGALSLLIYYGKALNLSVVSLLDVSIVLPVFAGVMIIGVVLCLVAALFAANRYLRLSYDEMFK